ncbi:flagellar biosynthetic protein FliR [Massilia antarctica]|uniref:flagellar biosynthetic protein FliR n=1 Tax=Massilia antarctica TaxID=2765360 RepID=UPI0006BB6547|nr:flagellar biosynthetic protein FliR [Massilia sp. H27-R4]MCY0911393.1 flagellar biosynthetic protein FliR [Massilia sp. H27-R4]CUI05005.1 Flagellar biosynthesis protein FliR [Janthinobacterium sp. CG23_2]CUU28791.1 Flagellar biosynthesis protein FliR [Janthinobacterium sp. CG23_2]
MLTLTSAEMNAWIAGLLWPLSRILGLITSAPLFGNASVPVPVKIGLGVLLASIIAPAIPAIPAADPLSMAGLLILVQELLIGVAMGFAIRLVFAAIEMAGEISSLTMGLGFASFFDPLTKGRSSAVSQFLALIATMAFLAANAHLVLLEALAESFISMPISATPMSSSAEWELAKWGGLIFSAGLHLSLPVVAALLITQVALGILTRAAPQLNIFGIGFPITLGVGMLVIVMVLPYLGNPFQVLFNEGIETARRVPRMAATPPPAAPARADRPAALPDGPAQGAAGQQP